MVAEPWLLRMGNQVSTNVKHALLLENSKKLTPKNGGIRGKQLIGILSFEVANVMSMIIHLHKSLTDTEIVKLKYDILNSIGIRTLVCDDETKILELALVEKLDDLNRVASVVSRLGRKCTIPALRGFEHVFGDISAGAIDVKELEFLVKDMERMVRKMERYVGSTARLYCEMEVMNELEVATRKFRQNHHEETWRAYEQKLTWQKQDVRHFKDVSLWNQTYDKVVELLARTVCTVYARISKVFGDIIVKKSESFQNNNARFGSKSRVMLYALPSTVGGSGLALHYANIVIVIEKLLQYPHLVGEEARDDLYQMLPESLRKNLKTTLRPYMKGLEIYDAPVAHKWKQRVEDIMKWLAPLAHNMMRWQSERNFEQHNIVKRTNVLFVQTLYFADRDKTEAVLCELLVGLNYLCRYEQQQNALLDCTSSFDFEDYMEWQLQLGGSFQAG